MADYDLNLRVASKFQMCYLDIIISRFIAGGLSTNAIDEAFGKEFESNIIDYFFYKLYKSDFKDFEWAIINEAKLARKQLRLVRWLYLCFVASILKHQRENSSNSKVILL